jgi:hypothetical protein
VGMAPSKDATARALDLPERLKPLAEQLGELSDGDRELVIRAVESRAHKPTLRSVSWKHLDELAGIVAWGGNADEDCRALYDG